MALLCVGQPLAILALAEPGSPIMAGSAWVVEEGRTPARLLLSPFWEMCALTGENVGEVFMDLAYPIINFLLQRNIN